MTELDKLISKAFASEGKQEDVNKVYLSLIRSKLYVPCQQEETPNSDEPFVPLFAKIDDKFYMSVFDTYERLLDWAGDKKDQISYVELPGKDLIFGISDTAYLCLNVGTDYYKEFLPEEIKRLKMIVSRIEQLKP